MTPKVCSVLGKSLIKYNLLAKTIWRAPLFAHCHLYVPFSFQKTQHEIVSRTKFVVNVDKRSKHQSFWKATKRNGRKYQQVSQKLPRTCKIASLNQAIYLANFYSWQKLIATDKLDVHRNLHFTPKQQICCDNVDMQCLTEWRTLNSNSYTFLLTLRKSNFCVKMNGNECNLSAKFVVELALTNRRFLHVRKTFEYGCKITTTNDSTKVVIFNKWSQRWL